ncbi:MAG: hypothetical protein GY906_08185 [bacterium]|nr:hypothetical protein [bacterium]
MGQLVIDMKVRPVKLGIVMFVLHTLAVLFLLIPSMTIESDASYLMFHIFQLIELPVWRLVISVLRSLGPLWGWIVETYSLGIGYVMLRADIVVFFLIGGAFYFAVGYLLGHLINRISNRSKMATEGDHDPE